MDILKYIKEQFSHFYFTENEIAILREHITVCQFKRNEFFLKEGSPCLKIGLLVKGTAYSYKINEDGEEVVQGFLYPEKQDILFDYESYIQNKHSDLNIKFQEDTTISYFLIERIIKLHKEYPRFMQFELLLVKQEFLNSLRRNKILQLASAEEKIKLLQEQNPKVFELFPYGQIASYLGVHRNTFRRVFSKDN